MQACQVGSVLLPCPSQGHSIMPEHRLQYAQWNSGHAEFSHCPWPGCSLRWGQRTS